MAREDFEGIRQHAKEQHDKRVADTPRRIVQPAPEFTASVTLTEEAAETLRKFAAAIEAVVPVIKHAMKIVKEMMDSCPNRRVVHLALRHRDPLVRKKNMKRLMRITLKTLKEARP